MEFNDKLVRTVRKMVKRGESLPEIAETLTRKSGMTYDDAWHAIDFSLS